MHCETHIDQLESRRFALVKHVHCIDVYIHWNSEAFFNLIATHRATCLNSSSWNIYINYILSDGIDSAEQQQQ